MHRWLLLILAACGGGDDAAMLDGGGSPDAPGSGNVVVRVAGSGAPAAGVTVIVDTQTLVTDASGVASAAITQPALVTVIDPPGFVDHVYDDAEHRFTFAAVSPGDEIDVAFGTAPPPAQPITMSVIANAYPDAEEYDVITSCGGQTLAGPTGTWTASRACTGPMDVLAEVTLDGEIGATLWAGTVTPVDGGTIDLRSQVWQPLAPRSYRAVGTGDWLPQPLLFVAGGRGGYSGGGGTIHDGGTDAIPMPVAPDANNAVSISYQTGGYIDHSVFAWGIGDPYTFDATDAPLSDLANPMYDATSCSWSPGAGAAPEGVRAVWAGPAAGADLAWYWIGPPPADGHITLPALPAPHDFGLDAVEGWTLYEANGMGGLGNFRAISAEDSSLQDGTVLGSAAVGEAQIESVGNGFAVP
ncbi:MAG TPA: hypothetical protein VGM88_33075 [Kofleriaceae bacterium]|jgi:hypothetical protein